jgi:hypothetical protein
MRTLRAREVAGVSHPANDWRLWRHWVLANVVGEIVGFGLAMVIGVGVAQVVEQLVGVAQVAAMIGAVIAVGSVEGAAVGLAQWLVLRTRLPSITRRAWLWATVAGAIVAWGVGMAVGSMAGDQLETVASGSPVVPAVVIGLAAGTILSLFQWLVLRRVVTGAGWWVPAHAVAWTLGMAVAFAGISSVPDDAPVLLFAVVGAATGLAMGAIVAALTGVALVFVLRSANGEMR